jgi:uncharacterized protein
MTMTFPAGAQAEVIYKFGGGPVGGIFQFMAGGVSIYPPVSAIKAFRLSASASEGSLDNLRKVNSGAYAFGVVYATHAYQGRRGLMNDDRKTYENVLGVGYFFGAPAQLVVKQGSGIDSAKDLVGKKVDVGNEGSVAFANCKLFFTHMGIWDKIERNTMGYNDAAVTFVNDKLDAFWLSADFPTGAAAMAAHQRDIDLVDLAADARASGFFEKYPCFSHVSIPAGTYKGVDYDVPSFQDSALWVANANVPVDVVYTLLSKIYSPAGLAHMVNVNKNAKSMSIANGIRGIVIPLHPGATRFWKEKGLLN